MTDPKTVTVQERLLEKLERKIASTGAWMTSDLRGFYTELRDCIKAFQSERASMEGEIEMLSDEAGLRELGLLYNCSISDDSPQFTRWQMVVAMNHGIRLVALTSSKTGDER